MIMIIKEKRNNFQGQTTNRQKIYNILAKKSNNKKQKDFCAQQSNKELIFLLQQRRNQLDLRQFWLAKQKLEYKRLQIIKEQIIIVKNQRAKIAKQIQRIEQARDNAQQQYVRLRLEDEDFEIIKKKDQFKISQNGYHQESTQQLKFQNLKAIDFSNQLCLQFKNLDILEQEALRFKINEARIRKTELQAQLCQISLNTIKGLSNGTVKQLKQEYQQLRFLCDKIRQQKRKSIIKTNSQFSIGYSAIFSESGWL